MTRLILLAIILFVAITFFFIALKGILRRIIGVRVAQVPQSKHRVLYKKDDVVVLQGEAQPDSSPNTP